MTPDILGTSPPVLGRRVRASLSPQVTGRAYGDAGNPDLDINGDTRQARPAMLGHGGLSFTRGGHRGLGGASSFGGYRHPQQQESGAWYNPGGPGGAYGGGWADGVLTVRDRHIMTRRGHTRWGAYEGNSGIPNPEHDGPPMPEYQMVDTTESWQLGTDNTASEDNTGQHNSVEVIGTGKRFPLGQQDGTETLINGPPIGEWREYGARGPVGMHGPAPDIYDPNVRGKAQLVATGAPGMQPQDYRTVYGGVPHGLHSPTAQSTTWTGARFSATPQMTAPRLDRPASSRIAGQSMSQSFPPEASFGESRSMPRTVPVRMPGLDQRFRGRS